MTGTDASLDNYECNLVLDVAFVTVYTIAFAITMLFSSKEEEASLLSTVRTLCPIKSELRFSHKTLRSRAGVYFDVTILKRKLLQLPLYAFSFSLVFCLSLSDAIITIWNCITRTNFKEHKAFSALAKREKTQCP